MQRFNFKKKFGQNFLTNQVIIDKIVDSINPTEKDLIIEIGPGAGAITTKLKKYNTRLLAFEIDTDTKIYLEKLEDEKTKIIYKDFLTTNIQEEIKNYKYEKLYFIGNLPYYITTPIIEKIIDSGLEFDSLTVMVQKEVADRFNAKLRTKDYGYMTVLLQYWFEIKKIVDVKRGNFMPAPNVDSTVIKLKTKQIPDCNYGKFKNLIKDAFQFKRKTLNNNLKNYEKEEIEKILKKHGYSLQNRAEEIDIETFIEITNNI